MYLRNKFKLTARFSVLPALSVARITALSIARITALSIARTTARTGSLGSETVVTVRVLTEPLLGPGSGRTPVTLP